MIRFRFKELLADREYREKQVITTGEAASATGIHRGTLSKIANDLDYNTGTGNLNRLCRYAGCRIDQPIEYVRD